MALALLGVGLMVMGRGGTDRKIPDEQAVPSNAVVTQTGGPDYVDFIDELEREVTLTLNQITGVGNVKVLIVPTTSEIKVLAEEVTTTKTRSNESPSGKESTKSTEDESVTRRPVIVSDNNRKVEEPVVRYTEKPKVGGVLVVAEGASDPRIRYLVLKAVSTVLDVPPHRVDVVAKR